ncbi:hypothetical protein PL10110_160049 [Planktothrix agardhii]|nr:hypothetical protein PL10110_160049 [Planktothrix agardhii]
MIVMQRLSAAAYLGRYANTSKSVKVICFQPRLGKQRWSASLLSPQR